MSGRVSGSRQAVMAGGFTLLQLMIVMGMITVLVAIGVSFLWQSKNTGRKVRAAQLVQRLEVGCYTFNCTYLRYPSSPCLSPRENSAALFALLCSPLNVGLGPRGFVSMSPAVMTDLASFEIEGGLPTIGPGQTMPPRAILDPWGNPVNYIRLDAGVSCPCRRSLPVMPAGGHDHRATSLGGSVDVDCTWGRENDPSFMDCRRTCDIESMGPPSFRGYTWDDNDITNWKPNRQ